MDEKNNLRKLREKQGLSQEQVANILHITRQQYSHIELGRRGISADILNKLADYFQVTTDYLLNRIDIPQSQIDKKIEKDSRLINKLCEADDEIKASVEQYLNFLLAQKEEANQKKR